MKTTGRMRTEIFEADGTEKLADLIDKKFDYDWRDNGGHPVNFIDIKYNVILDADGRKNYSAMVITMD